VGAPQALRALKFGTNLVNPIHAWPNQPTYELRLAKYAARGFAVAVPSLQPRQVDLYRAAAAPLPELSGLMRLIHIDLELAIRVNTVRDQPNARIPTLTEIFGTRHFFSGYGDMEDAVWNRPLALPTEEEQHRRILGGFYAMNTIPAAATDDQPNSSAWVVVVPAKEEPDEDDDDDDDDGNLPLMDSSRRQRHWDLIVDAGRDNLRIPRRLEWALAPRSREYLNAKEVDLDENYFAAAYKHAVH